MSEEDRVGRLEARLAALEAVVAGLAGQRGSGAAGQCLHATVSMRMKPHPQAV
jgi:hypothetical protein